MDYGTKEDISLQRRVSLWEALPSVGFPQGSVNPGSDCVFGLGVRLDQRFSTQELLTLQHLLGSQGH